MSALRPPAGVCASVYDPCAHRVARFACCVWGTGSRDGGGHTGGPLEDQRSTRPERPPPRRRASAGSRTGQYRPSSGSARLSRLWCSSSGAARRRQRRGTATPSRGPPKSGLAEQNVSLHSEVHRSEARLSQANASTLFTGSARGEILWPISGDPSGDKTRPARAHVFLGIPHSVLATQAVPEAGLQCAIQRQLHASPCV